MPKLRISPWLPVFLCALWRLDARHILVPFLLAAGLHEAGHMGAILMLGGEIRRISLGCTGAEIQCSPLSPLREAVAAGAGPLVSLGLVLSPWPWVRFWGAAQAVFNLMPVLPLDGGRVLYGLLSFLLGEEWSFRILRASAVCVLALTVVLGLTVPGLRGILFAMAMGICLKISVANFPLSSYNRGSKKERNCHD